MKILKLIYSALFKDHYRIVEDTYLGYEVQKKRWWFPFWLEINFANTHTTLEKAKEYLEKSKQKVVYKD